MHIALIPSWYDSPRAPSRGSFIRAQGRALVARGHRVSVIVPDRDADGPLLRVRHGVEDGMAHARIAVPSPWHRALGFYAPSVLARTVSNLLDEIRPDVVHAHAVRPAGVLAEQALRGRPIPLCLTEHSSPLRAFWWTPHGHAQMARAYHASRRLFAVSEFLRGEMRAHFPDATAHAEVLHNGIDTSLFRETAPPPGEGRLLFVGGLEPKKGVAHLLTALATLPAHTAWTLTLVGTGPLGEALRAQARTLGLDARLRWHGTARHEEMPGLYAAHDVLVVPSLHETFSLVCAEALACGRPVVATRCGGPQEVVPSFGGVLVAPGDDDALAGALRQALAGALPFERARAVAHVQAHFSMIALAERLEKVYEQLVVGGA